MLKPGGHEWKFLARRFFAGRADSCEHLRMVNQQLLRSLKLRLWSAIVATTSVIAMNVLLARG